MNNKYVFMAFAKGNETKESAGSFKKYEGFGISKILAVNPTKKELEAILGREIANEPTYVDKDANGVDRVKLSFVMQTVADKNAGIDIITIGNLWLKKQTRVSQSGKTQMIDKYGTTKWLTKDELTSPIDAFDNASARPTCNGEEELTNLLRIHNNINPAIKYNQNTGVWSFVEGNLTDSEARIDNVAKLFSGDVSEIKAILNDKPDNLINVLYYVSQVENKEYQNVYLNKVTSIYAKNLNPVKDNVLNKQQAGGLPGVNFYFGNLRERVLEPTDIGNVDPNYVPKNEGADDDLPWA